MKMLERRCDYAFRAMLHLAQHETAGRCKARTIAEDMAIPASYLPQILRRLVVAGLVSSQPGSNGGYALARPAGQTRLLEVIEAVAGPTGLETCVLAGGPGPWEEECPLHRFWVRAQEAFRERLRAVTVADLAAVDSELPRAVT